MVELAREEKRLTVKEREVELAEEERAKGEDSRLKAEGTATSLEAILVREAEKRGEERGERNAAIGERMEREDDVMADD